MNCKYCLNSFVDDELDPNNDGSSFSVGKAANQHAIYLTTGGGGPTLIEILGWNEQLGQNVTLGNYAPKFCPECGRKLVENNKFRATYERG